MSAYRLRDRNSVFLLALVSMFAIGGQTSTIASLIAHDDFEYGGVGSDLHGNGGGIGFADSWSGNTSYNIASGSLNSPRDPLPLVGNSVSGGRIR